MNTTILRRSLASGWRGLLIVALAVAAMLALGLWVYRGFDLSIYDHLPQAVRALMGIPLHADPALLAYNEMLAAIGALAFVGVGIALGAQSVAGEEQDRTLHLVLSTPISRTSYVLSRAAGVVLLMAGGGVVLWAVAALMPHLVGTATGDAHILALIVHLTAAGIFHASLALAVGAATGRKAAAAGVAAAVMVLGWLASSLLPMWRAGAAGWVPWTWFNGSKPLVNGVDGGYLALLLGGSVLLIALAVVGLRTRELRLLASGPSLLESLRANPYLGRLLAPTGRGTSLLGLRLAAQQVLVGYVVVLMGLIMGLAMPPMFKGLSGIMDNFAATFPQTMTDLFGGGDLSVPAGFLHLETFGMVAPAAVIVVATVAATSGISGEQRTRRMSLLLAQPISRARIFSTIALTSALYVTFVSVALFLGSWAGIALSGIDVSIGKLVVACLMVLLLGWFFGALALFLAAATGRSHVATWGVTGVAVATYFGYTLLLAAGKESVAWWSPFRPYLYGPPLIEGVAWWQPVWLLVGTVVLLGAALPLFIRRDIRITA